MKKYLPRYLLFWAPAFALSLFFRGDLMQFHALRWFFTFFMLLGWGINTAMAAYHYPRKVLSGLLMYAGAHVLLITWLYSLTDRSPALYYLAGAFSFTPLDILVTALLDFNIMHELYAALTVIALCLLGWAAGALYRRTNPNPYRPKIGR
ncbi:MAG: hypothetical protein FWH02_08825 [Oscillospiraceae bacterium]|nr:hypothetical protein [Oscillospiraceae bacterium]